jgi:hypothetical protein
MLLEKKLPPAIFVRITGKVAGSLYLAVSISEARRIHIRLKVTTEESGITRPGSGDAANVIRKAEYMIQSVSPGLLRVDRKASAFHGKSSFIRINNGAFFHKSVLKYFLLKNKSGVFICLGMIQRFFLPVPKRFKA